MSNIFRSTAVHYFQIPQDAMKPPVWLHLKPVAKLLYIHLLYLAQLRTKEFHTLTDEQIAEATGMSVKSVPAARTQLNHMQLVSNIRDSKGHLYQILDPSTGKPIERIQDFNTVSTELLEEFFMDRLQGYDAFRDENGLRATCPFHVTMKRRRRDLSVKLSSGGVWRCLDKSCAKRGKLVEFERLMVQKSGPPITSTEAHHRVRDFLTQATRRRDEKEAEELAARRAMM